MANVMDKPLDAIRDNFQGKSTITIFRPLGRIQYWSYKWLNRANPASRTGFRDDSRVPIGLGTKPCRKWNRESAKSDSGSSPPSMCNAVY